MKKVWFRRKQYGWGWYPVTWQGWLILLAYVLGLIKIFLLVDRKSHSNSDTLISFALPFIIFSSIFIVICYKTGEKPKWQWGKSSIDK